MPSRARCWEQSPSTVSQGQGTWWEKAGDRAGDMTALNIPDPSRRWSESWRPFQNSSDWRSWAELEWTSWGPVLGGADQGRSDLSVLSGLQHRAVLKYVIQLKTSHGKKHLKCWGWRAFTEQCPTPELWSSYLLILPHWNIVYEGKIYF